MDILLIIIIVVVPLLADIKIRTTYKKYLQLNNNLNLSGYEVARKILDSNNLQNINIEEVSGELSDHYNSRTKTIRLSKNNFHSKTISAISVAAHECGHAIQDKEEYIFFKVRTSLYPMINIATSISYWILVIGFLFQLVDLIYIGIGITSFGLLFQIITLPVEFNASKRAIIKLQEYNLITEKELQGTKNVLNAAAMTYIAGALASAMQIIRLLLIAKNKD